MKKLDVWISALIRLRRCHCDEIKAFHVDETYLLGKLNRRFRVGLGDKINPMEKATFIGQYTIDLKQLQTDRDLRQQALRRRHSEMLYDLLRSKSDSLIEN